MLNQAEKALSERQLEKTRRLLEEIQAKWPEDPTARQKMRELERLEEAAAKVGELHQQADDAMGARQYKPAQELYSSAYNLAGQHGIQQDQAELERKRNRAVFLETWQQRMMETQQQVQQHENKQEWAAAKRLIDDLVPQIPQEDALGSLRTELEEARRRISEQGDDAQKFREAKEAFERHHFKQVIELCRSISPNYAQHAEVTRKRQEAQIQQQTFIDPALARAERAYQKEHWANAFAELEKLREDFPENPDWRQKWLQIGEAYGLQELDAGRQANSERDFQRAKRHFSNARDKAFSKILDVYPTYAEAKAWQDEADDLIQIATAEQQAEKDWQNGRRQDALSALQEAQQIIVHAQAAEREYVAVAATVKAMTTAIKNELTRIEAEASSVQDGERLLAAKRPDEAVEKFRMALNALLPKTQNDAADGLNRAEAILRQFADDTQMGQSVSDPQEAVQHLQAAYDRWPSGPEIARLLETALVQATRAMLDGKNTEQAAAYADRALKLNPHNQEAQRLLGRVGLEPRVDAALTAARDELTAINRQDEIHAADFQPLCDRLQTLLAEVGGQQKTLSQRIETVLNDLCQQQQRWQAYETAYQQAVASRDNGRWAEAVTELENALQLLEGGVTPGQQQQLKSWRSAADALQKQQPKLTRLLEEAQKAYEEAPQTGKYDTPLTILNNVAKTWQRIEERIGAAEGGYAPDLLALQRQMQALRERVELALEAFNSPVARGGLVKLHAYTRRQGTDATLTALEQELAAQVRGQIPELLSKAEVAEQTGDLTEALDLLRQASDLEPKNRVIQQQYVRLQQRKRLEDRLQAVIADYQRKLGTGSYKDAVKSLRDGIDIFLEPGIELPAEAESSLRALTQIVILKGETAFADEETWTEANGIVAQLTSAVQESLLGKRALQITNLWLETSRTHALRGVAESTALIEDKMKGHRAARALLLQEPNDPELREQFAETKAMVIASLNDSASHRLQRGQQALAGGEFARAVEEAERVETEIYGPAEQEFEGFLAGEPVVADNRDKAAVIIRQAKELQQKDEKARPFYIAARDAYAQNNLTETQKQLDQIGDITGLPGLAEDVQQLRQQLAIALEETIRQKLNDELTAANVDLTKIADLSALRERLLQLQAFPQADLNKLPKADRDRYRTVVTQVETRIQELDQGSRWYEEGKQAQEAGDFATAVKNLQRALDNVPSHTVALRVEIRKLLDQAEEAYQARRDREESVSRAKKLLGEADYYRARQELLLAQDMGVEVSHLLNVAQAGMGLQNAQEAYAQGDWEVAEIDLGDAVSYTENNPEAEIILHDIRRLQKLVARLKDKATREAEQMQEQQRRLAGMLVAARNDLFSGQFEQAQEKVNAVLGQDPTHENALRLQADIHHSRQADAQKKREEAERAAAAERDREERDKKRRLDAALLDARRELAQGKFDEAQKKVADILSKAPTYEEALKLENELQRTRRAQELLQEAEAARKARNYALAHSTVETILDAILPGYAPAVTLQKQIDRERPITERLQQAEKLARSHQFEQARAEAQSVTGATPQQLADTYALISKLQLERAEKLVRSGLFQEARSLVQSVVGADPAQLQQVQTLITQEEAKIIEPIEHALLDGSYAGALDKCRSALEQTSSLDIRQKLETLQAQIVERRARHEMDVLRKQMKPAKEPSDLDGVIVRLESLLAQEPQPIAATYREIRKLHYEALAQRLRNRLQQAEEQYKQKQWTEAINLLEGVLAEAYPLIQEAGELGRELGRIARQATQRKEQIEKEQQEGLRLAEEERGQKLLQEAESALTRAESRIDLGRAQRLAEQVLTIPLFKESDDAKALRDRTLEALDHYDKTVQALKNSQEQVNLRRYEVAETALRLPGHTVSPLMQKPYDHQRDLVRRLRQAEKAQYAGLWPEALENFLSVTRQEKNLEILLESDLERCRQHVMEQVIDEAQQALEALPPDWGKAHSLLENIEKQIWYTSTYAIQANTLRKKAASSEWLAKAIAQLSQSDGDVIEAQKNLSEARKLLPDEEKDALEQWEKLAEALLAWEKEQDWQTAANLLQDLYGPVMDLTRTKSLQQAVQTAREKAEAEKREAKALADIQQQVEIALSKAEYDQVASLIQKAQELNDHHSLTVAMKRAGRQHLLEKAQGKQERKQYGAAMHLGQYLEKLFLDTCDADDAAALAFARGLPGERQKELEAAVAAANAALSQYEASGAAQAIRDLETITTPAPGDTAKEEERLPELRRQLQELKDKVSLAKSKLAEYRRQRQSKEWEKARDALQAAYQHAPGYAPTNQAVKEFQDFLAGQAREKLAKAANDPRAFTDALYFCDLGLSLDDTHADLSSLQRELTQERDRHWQTLLRQIRQALHAWDLVGANRYLNQSVQLFATQSVREQAAHTPRQQILQHSDFAAGQFNELRDLVNQWEMKNSQVNQIKRHMEAGLDKVHNRNYEAAAQQFGQARQAAADFDEARLWQSYATNMNSVIAHVQADRFQQALNVLQTTESILRTPKDAILTSALGSVSRLRRERHQAVYDVVRLKAPVEELFVLLNEKEKLMANPVASNIRQAVDVNKKITDKRQAFVSFYQDRAAPPDSFEAGAVASTADDFALATLPDSFSDKVSELVFDQSRQDDPIAEPDARMPLNHLVDATADVREPEITGADKPRGDVVFNADSHATERRPQTREEKETADPPPTPLARPDDAPTQVTETAEEGGVTEDEPIVLDRDFYTSRLSGFFSQQLPEDEEGA